MTLGRGTLVQRGNSMPFSIAPTAKQRMIAACASRLSASLLTFHEPQASTRGYDSAGQCTAATLLPGARNRHLGYEDRGASGPIFYVLAHAAGVDSIRRSLRPILERMAGRERMVESRGSRLFHGTRP
jgi:hypothetical protein